MITGTLSEAKIIKEIKRFITIEQAEGKSLYSIATVLKTDTDTLNNLLDLEKAEPKLLCSCIKKYFKDTDLETQIVVFLLAKHERSEYLVKYYAEIQSRLNNRKTDEEFLMLNGGPDKIIKDLEKLPKESEWFGALFLRKANAFFLPFLNIFRKYSKEAAISIKSVSTVAETGKAAVQFYITGYLMVGILITFLFGAGYCFYTNDELQHTENTNTNDGSILSDLIVNTSTINDDKNYKEIVFEDNHNIYDDKNNKIKDPILKEKKNNSQESSIDADARLIAFKLLNRDNPMNGLSITSWWRLDSNFDTNKAHVGFDINNISENIVSISSINYDKKHLDCDFKNNYTKCAPNNKLEKCNIYIDKQIGLTCNMLPTEIEASITFEFNNHSIIKTLYYPYKEQFGCSIKPLSYFDNFKKHDATRDNFSNKVAFEAFLIKLKFSTGEERCSILQIISPYFDQSHKLKIAYVSSQWPSLWLSAFLYPNKIILFYLPSNKALNPDEAITVENWENWLELAKNKPFHNFAIELPIQSKLFGEYNEGMQEIKGEFFFDNCGQPLTGTWSGVLLDEYK